MPLKFSMRHNSQAAFMPCLSQLLLWGFTPTQHAEDEINLWFGFTKERMWNLYHLGSSTTEPIAGLAQVGECDGESRDCQSHGYPWIWEMLPHVGNRNTFRVTHPSTLATGRKKSNSCLLRVGVSLNDDHPYYLLSWLLTLTSGSWHEGCLLLSPDSAAMIATGDSKQQQAILLTRPGQGRRPGASLWSTPCPIQKRSFGLPIAGTDVAQTQIHSCTCRSHSSGW